MEPTRLTISPTDYQDGLDYRALDAIGQSDLKAFAKNRRKFYEVKIAKTRTPDPPSASFEMGHLIEAAVLMPWQLQVIPRDVLSKSGARAGNKWKEWRDSLARGVLPISESQLAIRDDVFAAIDRHPRVARILREKRLVIHPRHQWTCPHTGLDRKGEADVWLPDERILVDIKTTVDPLPGPAPGVPGPFDVEIWKWGYWIQAATYREMMNSTGEDVAAYLIVAIRNVPPYDVELHVISHQDMDDGDRWTARWMPRLQEAIETNDWGPRTEKQLRVSVRPRGFHGNSWDDERLVL